MKRALLLILCLLTVISLIACSSGGQTAKLIGRWESRVEDSELGDFVLIYHFTEEGEICLEQKQEDKIAFSIPSGTWKVEKDDTVVLEMDGKRDTFTFSVSETQLVLSREGMQDLIFDRV